MSTESNTIRKVKILRSEYIESSDLIRWSVRFLDDNSEQTYIWPSVDLLASLNIKGKVDSKVLHKFCRDMTNKDINLTVDSLEKLPKSRLTPQQIEYMEQEMVQDFNNFKSKIRGEKNG